MKKEITVLILISVLVISLDPRWALLIFCLILTILLLSIGGDNE